MTLVYTLIIIFVVYVIAIAFLAISLARYHRRIYKLRQHIDQIIDQMMYIHGVYLYDLRQTGFDTQQIDKRFAPKTQWIKQTQHMSMDTISCYQSFKHIAEEIMSLTGTRLFDPKMIQDTDMVVVQLSDTYQIYQKIRKILMWMTIGIYKIFDLYRI